MWSAAAARRGLAALRVRSWTAVQMHPGIGLVGGALVAAALASQIPASALLVVASASEDVLPPAKYPWHHTKPWGAYDAAAIRRGYEVYRNVCASCHSMNYLNFRDLVNVAHTEGEMKEIAADVDVEDGPNDAGEMFMRPGKLTDRFPKPYPNEEAARAANEGSYPPDLSLIVKARPGGEDYIFSLLTGYEALPPGCEPKDGLNYNPYFQGGYIAMPQQLSNGMIEYEDGTPASVSQLAKDVTTFLAWAAEPHQDAHKLFGLKACALTAFIWINMVYFKRLYWGVIKGRVTAIVRKKPRGGS